jgi:hypothetical protein
MLKGWTRNGPASRGFWFPDDDAAHVRIDQFFDSWRYPDAEAVASASAVDDEQTEEQDMDVEVWRAMPPRKPAGEPEAEPEPDPEPDQVDPLRAAFIQALADGDTAADPDGMMRVLRCGAGDFYAVLGELIDDGIVVEDGTGLLLSEGFNAA